MKVLVVEGDPGLGWLWSQHIARLGPEVRLAATAEEATGILAEGPVDALVVNLMLEGGSALAVADMARFRCPGAKVIFVSSATFFSDGSIFGLVPNAAAFLPVHTRPEDLAAIVQHYGRPN